MKALYADLTPKVHSFALPEADAAIEVDSKPVQRYLSLCGDLAGRLAATLNKSLKSGPHADRQRTYFSPPVFR
jgi:hypothetical protein